jgi:hypothetical protein
MMPTNLPEPQKPARVPLWRAIFVWTAITVGIVLLLAIIFGAG